MHKPGIVPLRPLGLGDLYDGAFTAIRRNPKPMVGLAALVSTAALVVPAIITLLLAQAGELKFSLTEDSDTTTLVTLLGSLMSRWSASCSPA